MHFFSLVDATCCGTFCTLFIAKGKTVVSPLFLVPCTRACISKASLIMLSSSLTLTLDMLGSNYCSSSCFLSHPLSCWTAALKVLPTLPSPFSRGRKGKVIRSEAWIRKILAPLARDRAGRCALCSPRGFQSQLLTQGVCADTLMRPHPGHTVIPF